MRFLKSYLLSSLLFLCHFLLAQNYQAINGSPYAGSLGSNPASIVHVPYSWDITPFSIQLKQATNAYVIEKYSLLSSPGNMEVSSANGIKSRFVYANQDIHLLNTRINLNPGSAIAFGANIRSYVYATVNKSNWQDTFNLINFLEKNTGNTPLSGQAAGSSWAEIYGSYARTIIENDKSRLNAGITLKLTQGLAGGYGRAQGVNYTGSPPPGRPGYSLSSGSMQYGYSDNFDFIDSNKSFAANRKLFMERTYSSIGANIGLEYILLANEDDEAASDYAYRTKIGISLMDIGYNKYRYGKESRSVTAGKPGITDTLLEDKFGTVASFSDFNDTIATIAGSTSQIAGEFFIYQPTRIVINVDQHITQNFFVNAEITIPVLPIVSKSTLIIRDMNLLAITPRWELRSIGAYLPISMNIKRQLWIGGAFKAGPVLLGTHNLANLFSKNKSQNGGVYLALTIRPGKKSDQQGSSRSERLPRKLRRSLDCPKF